MTGFLKKQSNFLEREPFLNFRNKHKLIGYIDSAGNHKILDDQIFDLKKIGCKLVFHEEAPLKNRSQNQNIFDSVFECLYEGDKLVVNRFVDLASTQSELVLILNLLQKKGIHLRVLDSCLDTQSLGDIAPTLFGFLSGIINFQGEILAKRRLKIDDNNQPKINLGGRPKTNPKKIDFVLRLRHEGCSYQSIRDQTGLALTTIRRIIVDNRQVV